MEQFPTESTFSFDDIVDRVYRHAGRQFDISESFVRNKIEEGIALGKLNKNSKFQTFYNYVVSTLGNGKQHMSEYSSKPESEAGSFRSSRHIKRMRNRRY